MEAKKTKTREHKWKWDNELADWYDSYYWEKEFNEFGQTHSEHLEMG